MEAGLATALQNKRRFLAMIKKHSAFEIQMSISHSICAEISEEKNLRDTEKRYRRDIEEAVRAKRSEDIGSRGTRRPYTHADNNTAVFKCSTVRGISQGKKFADDI